MERIINETKTNPDLRKIELPKRRITKPSPRGNSPINSDAKLQQKTIANATWHAYAFPPRTFVKLSVNANVRISAIASNIKRTNMPEKSDRVTKSKIVFKGKLSPKALFGF